MISHSGFFRHIPFCGSCLGPWLPRITLYCPHSVADVTTVRPDQTTRFVTDTGGRKIPKVAPDALERRARVPVGDLISVGDARTICASADTNLPIAGRGFLLSILSHDSVDSSNGTVDAVVYFETTLEGALTNEYSLISKYPALSPITHASR